VTGPTGPQGNTGPQGDTGPQGLFGGSDHGSLVGLGDDDHPQYVLSSTNLALSTLVQDTADVSSIFSGNITVTGTTATHIGTIGTVDTATFGLQSSGNTAIIAPSLIFSATNAYQFRQNGYTTYTDTAFPDTLRNIPDFPDSGILVTNTGTDNIDTAGAVVPMDAEELSYGAAATDYSYTAGNAYVTINTAGTYEVTVNVGYTSTVQRWNGILKIYQNTGGGTPNTWIGYGASKHGYLRSQSGHNEASLIITLPVTVTAGTTIAGWVEREAVTGTCSLVANESYISIKRLA
jgi:hypothetical protein